MSQIPAALGKEELWKILVETAHAIPMYKNHKRYVEDVMMKERPEISPQELGIQINVTLGEALVLLDEVRGGKSAKSVPGDVTGSSKASDRSLLDFNG
jgi:hypothetical protein